MPCNWLRSLPFLVLLCVSMLVMGCASVPAAPLERELPPAEWLEDCAEPPLDVSTNGGLARAVGDLRGALKLCNQDKKALREWAQ
jgi:hypothetical protein